MGKGTCIVEGCERLSLSRQLCGMHWQRWSKHGDPNHPGRRFGPKVDTEADFWANVNRCGPTECWEWQGQRDRGYGNPTYKGRQWGAHRLAWLFTYGDPSAMFVCHSCDNPPCCNPAHLFLGTAIDNNADMRAKGRGVNPRGSKHGRAKLSEAQVLEIRALHAAGWTQVAIAVRFGIHRRTVGGIVNRAEWTHI